MLQTQTQRWHCQGTLIPEGSPIEFWVADGCISHTYLPSCTTIQETWICPGLFDGHVHIGWTHKQSTPQQRKRLVMERREIFASQGILYVRDMGSNDNLLIDLKLHGDAKTQVIPCGKVIMPSDGLSFPQTPPEYLIQAVS